MQEAVLSIKKLGAPPEGFECGGRPGDEGFPSEETLDLWDEYQNANGCNSELMKELLLERLECYLAGQR